MDILREFRRNEERQQEDDLEKRATKIIRYKE